MTPVEVHTIFTDILTQSKLSKACVEFNVNSSTGVNKARFTITPETILLITNHDLDSGVGIVHQSNYVSTSHPSRDWSVSFTGKTFDTMQSDLTLLFDKCVELKDQIVSILTHDYTQDVADIKQHIKQDEKDISDIESKVFQITNTP